MKKFLCAAIVIVFMTSLYGDISAASRVKYNVVPQEEIQEAPKVEDREEIKNTVKNNSGNIISTPIEPAYEQENESAKAPQKDEYNKYVKDFVAKKKDNAVKTKKSEPKKPAAEERNYQTGLQAWHNGATRQLTNWTFSKSQVTVELFNKGNSKASQQYTMKPYRKGQPKSGFVFTWGVKKGTQIVVPEGCEIHCAPSKVDISDRTEDDERGEGVAFSEGEVIYFTEDVSPGFTIFPYHAWPLD